MTGGQRVTTASPWAKRLAITSLTLVMFIASPIAAWAATHDVTSAVVHAINPNPAGAVKSARAVPAARAVAARSAATITPIAARRASTAVRAAAATSKHAPVEGTSAAVAANRARPAA